MASEEDLEQVRHHRRLFINSKLNFPRRPHYVEGDLVDVFFKTPGKPEYLGKFKDRAVCLSKGHREGKYSWDFLWKKSNGEYTHYSRQMGRGKHALTSIMALLPEIIVPEYFDVSIKNYCEAELLYDDSRQKIIESNWKDIEIAMEVGVHQLTLKEAEKHFGKSLEVISGEDGNTFLREDDVENLKFSAWLLGADHVVNYKTDPTAGTIFDDIEGAMGTPVRFADKS